MALPTITAPSGTPPWRVSPHDFTLQSPFAEVEFTTGHARKRRVTTGTTYTAQVEMLLREAKAAAVHEWFETTLEVGALPFAAALLSPSNVLNWWHARFIEPPTWEFVKSAAGPLWRLTASLRLEGDPSDTAPA